MRHLPISGKDLHCLQQACLALFTPGLSRENYHARSFAFLSALVPHESTALGAMNAQKQMLHLRFDREHPDHSRTLPFFASRMMKYELFWWDPRTNGGKPFSRSDFYSERDFRELDIYQDTYRPLGLSNHLALHVPLAAREPIVFFGLERSGPCDFSTRDRALLELAQPHLANAWSLAAEIGELEDPELSPEIFSSAGFTPRQAVVLYWLAMGKTNGEIAHLMQIQLFTVKAFVRQIFDHAGVDNRHAAILYALRLARRARRAIAEGGPVLDLQVGTPAARRRQRRG